MSEAKIVVFLALSIAFVWKLWSSYFDKQRLKKRVMELEQERDERDRSDARKAVYDASLEHLVDKSNQRFGAGEDPTKGG